MFGVFWEKLFLKLRKGPSAGAEYTYRMPIGGAAASLYIGYLAHLWRTGGFFDERGVVAVVAIVVNRIAIPSD